MKNFVKNIVTGVIRNDFAWSVLKPISSFGIFLNTTRKLSKEQKCRLDIERKIFQKLEVQNGPFKGMKYPKIAAVGSAIYPKLLGSYEKELWEVVKEFKNNNYTEIIDVGCAEGYYAIGFGLAIETALIYAYDNNEKARNLCKEMGQLNNIETRLCIKEECTADELGSFQFTGRGLIISDCEGFERQLFNTVNVQNLLNCDLIIETHDFVDIEISTFLKEIFNKTHNIFSIKSTDDIEKALTYEFEEIQALNLPQRKKLLAESRPSIMEWIICKSKAA